MKQIIKILLFSFIVFGTAPVTFAQLHSIQVKSFPMHEKDNALSFYNALKDSGYFVYMHKTKIDRSWWIRVKIGCYDYKKEAFDAANEFQKEFNLEYWVNNANVLLDNSNPNFKILSTPSGIWHQDNSGINEVYSFLPDIDDAGLLMDTKAVASPVSDEIVFLYQKKIIRVDIKSKAAVILKEAEEIEGLNRSVPKFSFDGKYIAYMDSYTWELPTKLWLMKTDGSNDRCIVDNSGTQNKVKNFLWHPSENKIYYIHGYAYGSMDMGGNLHYIVPESLQSKMLVKAESPYKIEKFQIKADEIILTIMEILDRPPGIIRTTKTIPIPKDSDFIILNAENIK